MRAHGGSSSALRRVFAAGSGKLAHFALRAVRSGRFSAKYASDNSSAGGAMLALSSSPARMIRAAFPCASGNTNALVHILTYLISAGRLCIPAAGFTYDIRGTCHTCCGCWRTSIAREYRCMQREHFVCRRKRREHSGAGKGLSERTLPTARRAKTQSA